MNTERRGNGFKGKWNIYAQDWHKQYTEAWRTCRTQTELKTSKRDIYVDAKYAFRDLTGNLWGKRKQFLHCEIWPVLVSIWVKYRDWVFEIDENTRRMKHSTCSVWGCCISIKFVISVDCSANKNGVQITLSKPQRIKPPLLLTCGRCQYVILLLKGDDTLKSLSEFVSIIATFVTHFVLILYITSSGS